MARQKGKSTRSPKESTNVPHSKRRRKEQKQQQEQQNAHSPPQEDVHDARPTDTFMELDTPLTDLEGEDSDDDESIDWETVELPKWAGATEVDHTEKDEDDGAQQQYHDVQVVFETPRAVLKKSKWEMAYQRQLRDWTHNSHVVLLVAHFMIRNVWCSRVDVKAVCLSVIPDHITSQSKRINDSDTEFGTTVKWLLTWWHDYFTVTGLGMQTRSMETFKSIPILDPESNFITELEPHMDRLGTRDSETIQDPSAFVNYLAEKSGCRDLSAQLFTSILRTLGFETRLICSLQPIPFRIPASRSEGTSTDKPAESSVHKTQLSSKQSKSGRQQYQTAKAKPPTVWCEVWNPHRQQWVCIDPIRQFYNKPQLMEPTLTDRQNVLSFVLAFEQPDDLADQNRRQRIKCVVDVTRRYTTHLPKALALRERELTKRERQGGWRLWSDLFLHGLQPTELRQRTSARYTEEQQQLEEQQQDQRMPTSIQGLRNHPLYVLERHLKKFEVLRHPTLHDDCSSMVIGHIRGEKIYPRSCVQQIHTRETWMKQGRVVKEGQEPVKRVLARAVTLEKKRQQEEAKMHGGEALQSDCFGHWQTTPYRPPPVVDGKITKNVYGRVDLFTPEMLPEGAVHLESGLGKIARQLGIDYAEAVVDFEFTRGRSIPSVNGIVVAKENELLLLEAWREHENHKTNKVMAKQERDAYNRWRKLILGAMIDARVDSDYGAQHSAVDSAQQSGDKYDNSTAWDRFMQERHQGGNDDRGIPEGDDGGGFIPQDDDDDDDGGFVLADDDSDEPGGFLPDDEDV